MNRNLLPIFIGIAISSVVVQQVLAQNSRLYEQTKPFVVLIQNIAGVRQGTGFIVGMENNVEGNTYYVLTAASILTNIQPQILTDSSELITTPRIIPLPDVGLALLQFKSPRQYQVANLANQTSAIQLHSSRNTKIFVLGYPSSELGVPQILEGNITDLVISSISSLFAVSHNVETEPGMIGSPVLTEDGKVVGINIGRLRDNSGVAFSIDRYRDSAYSVFLAEGKRNLGNGEFDLAISSVETGRYLSGENTPQALTILAYAYFGKDELEKAKDEANEAVRIKGVYDDVEEARLLLGTIYYLQTKYTNAIEMLSQFPNGKYSGYAYAILALSHSRRQSRVEANNSITSAFSFSSLQNDPFAYFTRSCVNLNLDGATTDVTNDLISANRLGVLRQDNLYIASLIPKLQESAIDCIPLSLRQSASRDTPRIGRYTKSGELISLNEGATSIAVSRDSRFVAVGLRDGNVSIYDLQTRNRVTTFNSDQVRVAISSVAFSPNGQYIAIAAANGEVRVSNIQRRQEEFRRPDFPTNIFDPRVSDIQSRQGEYRLAAGTDPKVVFSNNNESLFIGDRSSGTLRIVNNRTGETIASQTNTHPDGITSLSLSPDGRLLGTIGADGVVKLWRSDLIPTGSYQAHQGRTQFLTFSADGSQTISADFDTIKACNIQTKMCDDVARSSQVIRGLAVSLTNGHVAYSADNKIFLEDQRNKQSLGNLSDHRDNVDALAYTPNGQYLISGSNDKTMIIWDKTRIIWEVR